MKKPSLREAQNKSWPGPGHFANNQAWNFQDWKGLGIMALPLPGESAPGQESGACGTAGHVGF